MEKYLRARSLAVGTPTQFGQLWGCLPFFYLDLRGHVPTTSTPSTDECDLCDPVVYRCAEKDRGGL